MAAKVLKLKLWPDEAGGTVSLDHVRSWSRPLADESLPVETERTGYQGRSLVRLVRLLLLQLSL